MQALVSAVPLDPKKRLQQAIADYEKCLTDQERHTFNQLMAQGIPTVTDIVRLTAEIDREAGRKHRSWRSKGTRLTNLLTAIQRFASFGDIVVGGSQNLIACGIWAVVRIALQSSVYHVQYFERLSGLVMEIGRTAPIHSELTLLYPRSTVLQNLMNEYMLRVVQICQKAVQYSKKSTLAQITSSALSNFDFDFEPLSKELATIGAVIEKQVLVLSMQDQAQQYSMTRAFARQAVRDEKIFRLFMELSPELGAMESIRIRERKKGTTRWLFSTAEYLQWKTSPRSAALFVQGTLGCGKTVLFANIVDDLHLPPGSAESQPIIASSFCKFEVPSSRQARCIVGYLAVQIVRNPEIRRFLERFVDSHSSTDLMGLQIEDIVKLLRKVLRENSGPYFIVLDGLVECPQDDTAAISEFLRALMSHCKVNVCFSCRDDKFSSATVLSRDIPVCRTIYPDNSEEIEDFVVREMEERDAAAKLEPKLFDLVRNVLTNGAQGMFLWAALMLDEILPTFGNQPSPSEILEIIEHLPRTLPEVFDRSLCAIKDPTHSKQMFKLVTAVIRPLNQEEFLEAAAVKPGIFTWTPFPGHVTARSLVQQSGGNLLTIDEDGRTVHFIHHSVLQHLFTTGKTGPTSRFKYDPEDAMDLLCDVCVTYLNFGETCTQVIKRKDPVHIGARSLPDLVRTALPPNSVSAKIMWGLRKGKPSGKEARIDIGELLRDYRDTCLGESQARRAESFLGYAGKYWLHHSRTIRNHSPLFSKWMAMVKGRAEPITLPWTTHIGALRWAMENSHPALLIHYFLFLLRFGPLCREEVLEGMSSLIRQEHLSSKFRTSREELGDIIARLALVSDRVLKNESALLSHIDCEDELGFILKWFVSKGADANQTLVRGWDDALNQVVIGKTPVLIALESLQLTAASRRKLLRWLLESGASSIPDQDYGSLFFQEFSVS